MKQVKETRKKFKQEDVFDIGVKAKKVWEEVWDDTQTYCFRGEPRGGYREGGGGLLAPPGPQQLVQHSDEKAKMCRLSYKLS